MPVGFRSRAKGRATARAPFGERLRAFMTSRGSKPARLDVLKPRVGGLRSHSVASRPHKGDGGVGKMFASGSADARFKELVEGVTGRSNGGSSGPLELKRLTPFVVQDFVTEMKRANIPGHEPIELMVNQIGFTCMDRAAALAGIQEYIGARQWLHLNGVTNRATSNETSPNMMDISLAYSVGRGMIRPIQLEVIVPKVHPKEAEGFRMVHREWAEGSGHVHYGFEVKGRKKYEAARAKAEILGAELISEGKIWRNGVAVSYTYYEYQGQVVELIYSWPVKMSPVLLWITKGIEAVKEPFLMILRLGGLRRGG